MTLPSWRTTILGIRTRVSVHSRSRLRAGAMSPGRRMPGEIQRRGGSASMRMPSDGPVCPCRYAPNGFGNVLAVEGGDVGGVDRVQQVADGEDAGVDRGERGIDKGALGFWVHGEAGGAGEFVIGDPVPAVAEVVTVAGDAPGS